MSLRSIKNRTMLAAMTANTIVNDQSLDIRLATLGKLLMRVPPGSTANRPTPPQSSMKSTNLSPKNGIV